MYHRVVYRDRETGQRFIPIRVAKRTLVVYDVDARQKRLISRGEWDLDVEAGRLTPARATRTAKVLAEEADEMAAKNQKAKVLKAKVLTVKPLKKAKPAGAVGNKPVRDGSVKATYFAAIQKGGTVDAVMARLKGKVKGKVTPHRVQMFAGWAVKRGLVTADKANGVTRYTPGKATLELRGKK